VLDGAKKTASGFAVLFKREMTNQPPAVLVTKASLNTARANHQGRFGSRGGQKILVIKQWPQEAPLTAAAWNTLDEQGSRPVLVTQNIEFAVFDERAPQDRHHHKLATELYTVIEGTLHIEVENELYALAAGDTIIIRPGTRHEILRQGSFVATVTIANCVGREDKFHD
jgi:mannose-6-phosphate isomerase-like protein (cupin superfamily)